MLLLTSAGAQQQVIDCLDRYHHHGRPCRRGRHLPRTLCCRCWAPRAPLYWPKPRQSTWMDSSPYHSILARISGHDARIISRPLGELPNFDLLMSHDAASAVWECLLASGVTPAGEDAFQAMRMDYAVPVLGRELGDSYNPLEAGLNGSIDFSKGCYIGQEVIARLDTYQKVQKQLGAAEVLRRCPSLPRGSAAE